MTITRQWSKLELILVGTLILATLVLIFAVFSLKSAIETQAQLINQKLDTANSTLAVRAVLSANPNIIQTPKNPPPPQKEEGD